MVVVPLGLVSVCYHAARPSKWCIRLVPRREPEAKNERPPGSGTIGNHRASKQGEVSSELYDSS